MSARNVLKIDAPESYYHVYARGVEKRTIFLDPEDHLHFLSLLARYLSTRPVLDTNRMPYPHLYGQLELLAFCLMPNHFHLLLYQVNEKAMKTFMQGVMTSYSRYFNKKYNRNGALFESRYRASMILDEAYLEHISRYIHLNPKNWQAFPYSSLPYYLGEAHDEWIQPDKITEIFADPKEYLDFLKDYQAHKAMLDEIKHDLADTY